MCHICHAYGAGRLHTWLRRCICVLFKNPCQRKRQIVPAHKAMFSPLPYHQQAAAAAVAALIARRHAPLCTCGHAPSLHALSMFPALYKEATRNKMFRIPIRTVLHERPSRTLVRRRWDTASSESPYVKQAGGCSDWTLQCSGVWARLPAQGFVRSFLNALCGDVLQLSQLHREVQIAVWDFIRCHFFPHLITSDVLFCFLR